ncbi:MAG TPA: hypothetical protein VKX49_16580 [Bryobacteraceae bacterium]|nr:hypothetical protein [Bryobacteraceae bacterium]
MLALQDPYDPDTNEKLRLHDASLYHGKYYLYFGIGPAVTLYLPWHVLTGWSVSDDVAVTIFTMAGYVFSCLMLFLLLEGARLRPPWFLQAAAVLVLGIGQSAPMVLRRPRVYEVAVSAGYCFLLGGLYFFARRIVRPQTDRWSFVLGGVCLGLAVASRPHSVLVVLVVLVFYVFHVWRSGGIGGKAAVKDFAALLTPLAIAGVLIAWYNYARFENPFEFGAHYQVGVTNYLKEYKLGTPLALRLHDTLATLYYFMICAPDFIRRFPFFEMSAAAQPFGDPNLVPKNYFQEPVASVFIVSPLCVAALLLPFLSSKQKPCVRTVLHIVLLCGFVMFAGVCVWPSASSRYELDFVPAILIVGLYCCLWLYTHLQTRPTRIAASAITVAGCVWAVLLNMALSVNSYGYPLEQPRSATFASLASLFGAGPEALMNDVKTLHFKANLVFSRAKPGVRETLLSTGIYERWDLLFVQYQSDNSAIFCYVHSGVSYTLSQDVPIQFGVPQHLQVDYSVTSGSIVVRLNERTVIDFPTTWYPTSRDRLSIGKMRAGKFSLRDFSGEIHVTPGGLALDLGHAVRPRILTSSPVPDSIMPGAELMHYDFPALLSHTQHSFYGKPPRTAPVLPSGIFLATTNRDHFATAFESTAIEGTSSAAAVEVAVLAQTNDQRFGSINMTLQDQDYRTLYSSGTLPAGEDHAVLTLPPGTRAVRLALLANEEGYIVFPKTVQVRAFTNKKQP